MDNVSIFVKHISIMSLIKERNYLALPHLLGEQLVTENIVHSKLAILR